MAKSRFNKLGERIMTGVEKSMVQLTLDINAEVIEGTPVDTGWARANWIPGVGSFENEPIGDRDNISHAEQNSGIGEVLRYKIERGPIYITNNVPYINELNQGHSAQAPANFVEKAIQRSVNKFNKRKIL